ncbi:ABC transporter ATP-binding protein [Zoogloea sp.]|uniref:ABC transporter ATP-binding protein n=2 Tax=Zoogloea sp. TaxID=49181 RepID=UPI0035B284A0
MVPAIHLRDLSFAWPGQPAACLTLSALDVDQGEQVFIQGDSGAGKSTLLNLIGGVLLPREGRIQILGQALDALSAPARDRFRVDHIGFIFQQFNLLPYLSALDNVLLPCRFSATRARRAGPRPVEAAHRLLEALEVDAGDAARPASTLSVGQQQRVAAARALIGRPALVLADEPTSALDPRRQDAFLALLGKEVAAHGSSLVLVSHDPRLASRFDRCITL